ncbi:MAG: hypothetical protein ACFFE3_11640 [Candidatus Thorarchaeota archaeon]
MQKSGRDVNIRLWLPLVFAIIVLMFLPLSYSDYQEDDYSDFEYRSIAFTYIEWSGPELTIAGLTRLLGAIGICIPAIYLNHKLAKSSGSYRNLQLSILAILATMVLASYVSNQTYFPPDELRWFLPPGAPNMWGSYWSQIWDLERFGSLVITFLIIIPLFVRELRIVGSLRQSEIESTQNVNTDQESKEEDSYKGQSRKHLILGAIFGFIAVLLPVHIYLSNLNNLAFPNNSFLYEGYTFFFRFIVENNPIPVHTSRVYIEMNSPGAIIDQLPYAGLQLLFAYGILQYLQGKISRTRIYLIGGLSLILPLVYRVSANILENTEGVYVIPFPVVFIIGLLVLRFIRPTDTTVHNSPRETDRIQTPLQYLIKSQMSKLKRRIFGNSGRQ